MFLSNFYLATIEYRGITFESAEHAFQAEKAKNDSDREWIRDAPTPGEAKRRGRKIKTWNDWNNNKIEVMQKVIEAKFKNKQLAELLLKTGDEELVEGNWWGDTFWGVCEGKGTNHLGMLLMAMRKELRASKKETKET